MRTHSELFQLLLCPETRQRLNEAPASLIERINEKIRDRSLENRAAEILEKEIEGGFIREDGEVLYPVVGGISLLLRESGIEVE